MFLIGNKNSLPIKYYFLPSLTNNHPMAQKTQTAMALLQEWVKANVQERATDTQAEDFRYINPDDLNDFIATLLPVEREQVEAAHIAGQANTIKCFSESMPQLDLSDTFIEVGKAQIEGDDNATAYFTNTYQQNA